MTIQNSRVKASLRKDKQKMEAEANHGTQNGAVKTQAGDPAITPAMTPAPAPAPEGPKVSLEKSMLEKRAEEMQTAINTLKAEQDGLEKRLDDINQSILRAEGAIVMLRSIIETAGQVQEAA